MRYLNHDGSASTQQEIQNLRGVVALLDGQNQSVQNASPSNDLEIAISNLRDVPDVAEDIKVLQEVVTLLDVHRLVRPALSD